MEGDVLGWSWCGVEVTDVVESGPITNRPRRDGRRRSSNRLNTMRMAGDGEGSMFRDA